MTSKLRTSYSKRDDGRYAIDFRCKARVSSMLVREDGLAAFKKSSVFKNMRDLKLRAKSTCVSFLLTS